jgi:hypothetical protein
MEKDKIIETTDNDLFGDEELFDVIPDENDIEVDYNAHPEKIGSINWVNGRPSLSFSSLCDKTKSIFTQVKGIPIIVREAEDENYIYKSDSKYTINIAKKPIKGITKYTAFNHELGHYAFDSFNSQFPDYIDDQLKMIPKEHHDKALELYRSVFNVIEDQRVESLMGNIYLGIGKRFRQSRRRLGSLKDMDHITVNPLDALHCAREYRDDAVINKFELAKTIMKDVESKDGDASIILSREYIDKVMNPWIISQLKNCKNPFPRSKSKPINGDFKSNGTEPIKPTKKLETAFEEAFNENRSSDHREMDDSLTNSQQQQIDKSIAYQNDGNIKRALENSEENAENQIGKIMDKIEENARRVKISHIGNVDHIQKVDRTPTKNTEIIPRPNIRVARNINRILKLIQSRNKPKIRDVGDNISIPHVIKRIAVGYGDVMIKKTPKQKIAILVSIDASGSMDGDPIDTARDMMATLYKSIHGVEGIELRGVVWAGSGYSCLVSEVKSLKECNTIHCNEYSGGTPTPYAVEYCLDVIDNMKAKKKLMIVVTDGYPNSSNNPVLSADKEVRKEINKARSKGIGTMGLMVGIGRDRYMDLMFGKDGHVTVSDMSEASNAVIKKFKNVVLSQASTR